MLKVFQGGARFVSRGKDHWNGLRCAVAQEIVEGSSDNVIEEFGHFIPFVVGVQVLLDKISTATQKNGSVLRK